MRSPVVCRVTWRSQGPDATAAALHGLGRLSSETWSASKIVRFRGFAAVGGVARRDIYDNMKTAVNRVGRGKNRDVNRRFAALCSH